MNDQQFAEMAQEALDNWDFESADNGKEIKKALKRMVKSPKGLARVFVDNYRQMHGDKWQCLDEMASVYSNL